MRKWGILSIIAVTERGGVQDGAGSGTAHAVGDPEYQERGLRQDRSEHRGISREQKGEHPWDLWTEWLGKDRGGGCHGVAEVSAVR